jgi:hypothetical protein
MKKIILAFLILSLFSYSKCEKDKPDSNGLPAATQEGKNTLGFLLNGQPWVPQGFNGTANLSIDVDFDFTNGIFNLVGYRTINTKTEQFTIGISDSLSLIGIPYTFRIRPNSIFGISYTRTVCDYFSKDIATTGSGTMTITKLDRTDRIISGTFNATLSKADCEMVKITDGRFDMKF